MDTRQDHADLPVAEAIRRHGVGRAIGMKHVASVLYTYRCTLRCLHCCFYSSPTRPGVHVGLADGLEYLRQLHTLDRVVHIAGGEAMMYWDDLRELCAHAAREGVAPHFLETNTSWCVDGSAGRDRLLLLRDLGVAGLLLSADAFHQRDCPVDRYLRCLDLAVEVFGEANVMGARLSPEDAEALARTADDAEAVRATALASGVCLTGRAGAVLAPWFPDRPVEDLARDGMWHGPSDGMDCRKEFEPEEMWEIHIDPYGNAQTCCGVVVGSVRVTPLPELWQRGFLGNPLVEALHSAGPVGLLPFAVGRGYEPRTGYPQKCGMCWELRRFLRPHFPETFGPAEVYEDPPDEPATLRL